MTLTNIRHTPSTPISPGRSAGDIQPTAPRDAEAVPSSAAVAVPPETAPLAPGLERRVASPDPGAGLASRIAAMSQPTAAARSVRAFTGLPAGTIDLSVPLAGVRDTTLRFAGQNTPGQAIDVEIHVAGKCQLRGRLAPDGRIRLGGPCDPWEFGEWNGQLNTDGQIQLHWEQKVPSGSGGSPCGPSTSTTRTANADGAAFASPAIATLVERLYGNSMNRLSEGDVADLVRSTVQELGEEGARRDLQLLADVFPSCLEDGALLNLQAAVSGLARTSDGLIAGYGPGPLHIVVQPTTQRLQDGVLETTDFAPPFEIVGENAPGKLYIRPYGAKTKSPIDAAGRFRAAEVLVTDHVLDRGDHWVEKTEIVGFRGRLEQGRLFLDDMRRGQEQSVQWLQNRFVGVADVASPMIDVPPLAGSLTDHLESSTSTPASLRPLPAPKYPDTGRPVPPEFRPVGSPRPDTRTPMRVAMDALFGPPQSFAPDRVARVHGASIDGECSNADRQDLARRISTLGGWPSDLLWMLQRAAGLAVTAPAPMPGLPPGDFNKTYRWYSQKSGWHRVSLVGTNPSRCELVYDKWTGSLYGYRPTSVLLWDENSPPSASPGFTLELDHGPNAFAIRGSVSREQGTFTIAAITGSGGGSVCSGHGSSGPTWYAFRPDANSATDGVTISISAME